MSASQSRASQSRASQLSTERVVSAHVGTRDPVERFVPENEASSEEEELDQQGVPDDEPILSDLAYVQGQGAGYTKCDISTLTFTTEKTLHQFRLLSHLNISNFKQLQGGALDGLVAALPNLTVIYADNCNLTTIVGVEFNPGLRILSLAKNSLAVLPVLGDLIYLESINLAENKLDALFSQVFESCYSLREINARQNDITEVDLSDFSECLALSTINLADNGLCEKTTTWPKEPLAQVRNLNLSKNKFTQIPEQVATVFPGLFRFDIASNLIPISPDMNLAVLASLDYLYEFNVCEPHELDIHTRSLAIFYLQQLKKINNADISPEDKVNVESIFKPSIQQKARADHISQELHDLRQHKRSVPITCLPNMEPYPIFVFTGPSLSLRGSVKSMVQQSETYLPILRRINPVLDASSDFTQTFYEYICYDTNEFEALEAAGKFAAVGYDIADGIRYAFTRELVEQNAIEGFGTLCELPVTGAISLQLSEKFRPQVVLVMPDESEYRAQVEAKFGEDQDMQAQLMEEYYAIREIHAEQPGLFRIVVTPDDTDILVNYLFSLLEGNISMMQGSSTSQGSSKGESDSGMSMMSTQSRVSSGQRPSRTSKLRLADNVIPADKPSRRASLMQQARRRTVGVITSKTRTKTVGVGANMVFDLSKDTMYRRTVQAIQAISSTKANKFAERTAETADAILNQEHCLVESDYSICADDAVSNANSFAHAAAQSASPDWAAEGIIVLPDDATTLSNCQSARQVSSAGVSMRSSYSKRSKKVLPGISS